MKTNDYYEQDGCHNCMHSFVFQEWDDLDTYYCMQDGVSRPLCGSSFLNETRDFTHNNKWQAQYDAWRKWSEKRECAAWGMCSEWGQG